MDLAELTILAKAWALWLASQWQLRILLSHIALNAAFAIAVAIYLKTFELARFGEFLLYKFLPFFLVYAVSSLLAATAGLPWLTTLTWGALELSLLGDLTDNMGKLGLKMPGWTRKETDV